MKDTGLCYNFFYINLWKFKPVININVIRTYYLELIMICNVLFCSYWIYCWLCMHGSWVSSWSWTYGSWIYNFMCNQCLSPLRLWVRFTLMARCADIQFVCEFRYVGVFHRVYSGFLHQLIDWLIFLCLAPLSAISRRADSQFNYFSARGIFKNPREIMVNIFRLVALHKPKQLCVLEYFSTY